MAAERRLGDRALGRVGAGLDLAAMRAARVLAYRRRRGKKRIPRDTTERLRALAQIAASYPPGADFYPEPRAIVPDARVVERLEGGRLLELGWPSDRPRWLPELQEPMQDRRNDRAVARLWAHTEPRRAIVLIHGYMAGQWDVERRLWPADRLYRRGWDVALLVLPYHAVRGGARRFTTPRFPSGDPRRTNEGFRQIVGDLRDLAAWLRAEGSPSVGVMGMSLGGYTAALAATVDPTLAFVVPVIPLASVPDFARDRGHLGRGRDADRQHAALERAHRLVSPLHRAPLIPPERTFVVAAAGDRITPIHHAERLAAHLGATTHVWPGSHLLQVGRDGAYRRVERFLDTL